MLLLVGHAKVSNESEVTIIFEANRDNLRDIEAELKRGGEIPTLA